MNKLKYIWTSSKIELLLTFLILALAFLWVGFTNDSPFYVNVMDSWYVNWIDPTVTITTLLIAVFVWINNKLQEWKNELPKKLDAHFKFKGKYVISCFHANLIGEHDIRALAQQIGAQINKGDWLKFSPIVNPSKPIIEKTKSGKYYRSFSIEVNLNELPEHCQTDYRVWIVDSEDSNKIEKKNIKGHPIQFFSNHHQA
ncbi:MAG TPA: hypothetical protein ENJ95_04435 [Bacteroidetes bacterium]|nr:hypothetical protein [Bacteroidota bacterium]